MGHESPPTLPVAKPGGEAGWRSRVAKLGGLRGDTREPRGGHPHKGGRTDSEKFEPYLYRSPSSTRAPGSCAHVRTIKSDPRRKFRGPYPSECYAGIWSSSTSAFTTEEAEG